MMTRREEIVLLVAILITAAMIAYMVTDPTPALRLGGR